MHTGSQLRDMPFKRPYTALFFNHNPNKLIVACKDGIFIVDVITQSIQPFSSIPRGASYHSQALSLSHDDAVLVAGCCSSPYSVCGYNTVSRTRLWIHNTVFDVGAVCMHSTQVLVSVCSKPTLVLDLTTGTTILELPKAEGSIFGLGVVKGVFFNSF